MFKQPRRSTSASTAPTLFASAVFLCSCTLHPSGGPPPSSGATPVSADAVPRAEPKSRYGNGPVYDVFGQRYEVLPSSEGYREQGVASWYGQKFHGRPTASRERYDMYAMTAAHKSLPLPTYVEVRNLRNGRRVVVRVNDRGPFVDNRIIDLSYAAAVKLDMVQEGTSLVEVRALSFDEPLRDTGPRRLPAEGPNPTAQTKAPRVFVQVGAYSDRSNASRRYWMLKDGGIASAFVDEDRAAHPVLYRVRVGPIDGVTEYDTLVGKLNAIGIRETHLVTD